jgi:hypothetical protein
MPYDYKKERFCEQNLVKACRVKKSVKRVLIRFSSFIYILISCDHHLHAYSGEKRINDPMERLVYSVICESGNRSVFKGLIETRTQLYRFPISSALITKTRGITHTHTRESIPLKKAKSIPRIGPRRRGAIMTIIWAHFAFSMHLP